MMNKGQAFTVFKMMIGVAFAMMLLVIVYSSVKQVDCPSPAFIEVRETVLQASNAPGKCFEIKQLCISEAPGQGDGGIMSVSRG